VSDVERISCHGIAGGYEAILHCRNGASVVIGQIRKKRGAVKMWMWEATAGGKVIATECVRLKDAIEHLRRHSMPLPQQPPSSDEEPRSGDEVSAAGSISQPDTKEG
jgi:hypothetical protein